MTIIKKSLSKKINNKKYISATSIKNYLLNDPLLDWLAYYKINDIKSNPNKNRVIEHEDNNFLNYIYNKGVLFEKDIIEKLSKKYKIEQVCKENEYISLEKFEETKKLFEKGVPIIYQGALYNFKNNTYGIPDLLIRSDYINNLFPGTLNE